MQAGSKSADALEKCKRAKKMPFFYQVQAAPKLAVVKVN
jgi:hypothetical protein